MPQAEKRVIKDPNGRFSAMVIIHDLPSHEAGEAAAGIMLKLLAIYLKQRSSASQVVLSSQPLPPPPSKNN